MKPKKTIIPKAVTMNSTTDKEVEVKSSTSSDVEEKLNDHINNSDIHVDKQLKDSVSYLRKDVDSHLNNSNIHVTEEDKAAWNAKETPAGAQSKVNKVLNSLENHKSDYSIHITKTEKDSFKDKYTKAEVRNLVKHTLAGLKFLPAVNTRYEIESKYPDPDFNSAVYIRNAKTTLIFNGQNWVEFNGLFTPEVTQELDGLMTNEDKTKLDSIEENANNYIHPDNVDTRHVSDAQIDFWNKKADNNLVSVNQDGLMLKDDKKKLDSIEENANNYVHPDKHDPTIISEDELHRFVSDDQITKWDNKAEISYVDNSASKTLSASKAFTDSKISAIFNSTEEQLQVLRSLAFELKKDDTVKNFFDLFNQCAKNTELQEHTLNSKIHMSKADRNLLNDVKDAISTGMNADWNETNPSSIRYINNKPKALLADGGNADTIGGYTAEELLTNKSFYDYTIGTSDYTSKEVSVLTEIDSVLDTIENIVNLINKGQGYNVLFRPGSYSIEKELVINASNTTFSGIGKLSKLLGASIRIIGNNNTIENITLSNGQDNIVNRTAIYVEGNDNIIRFNTIMNYNEGILVEGSNNTVVNNILVNIRNNAVKLTSTINANYGNIINKNTIKNSNIGITLLSSKNTLLRNYITKNKVLNCSIGIVLSNTISNNTKTINNIINENIVIRGRGEASEYLQTHKTIVSEFSSKNMISSNITSGKEIVAPNDILNNNIF